MNSGIRIFFVSTGRCGTVRLAEILQHYLSNESIVVHQTKLSRIANIIGNIHYRFGIGEIIGEKIFHRMMRSVSNDANFVSTDPLFSMIIPTSTILSNKTHIIHIERDHEKFSTSIFRLTRKRLNSFLAHNFIPFWQPFLLPFENIVSHNIFNKYKYISEQKNDWFVNRYSLNPNYKHIYMYELFAQNNLSELISEIFDKEILIPHSELQKISNQT